MHDWLISLLHDVIRESLKISILIHKLMKTKNSKELLWQKYIEKKYLIKTNDEFISIYLTNVDTLVLMTIKQTLS